MMGVCYLKVQPTHYVMQFVKGQVVREGSGLSFFYWAPSTSLVLVPLASVEVPFMFTEVTADFQEVTVQGQITYRIADPEQVAKFLNYTLAPGSTDYASEDPQKLPLRLINQVQVLMRGGLKSMPLRDAIGTGDELVEQVRTGMRQAAAITSLGVEVLGLTVLAIKPKPETARALETDVREQLLRQADEAVYRRRNAAVEQERAIKENELNTEVAVENKKRQIREAQMDAEIAVENKKRQVREAQMEAEMAVQAKQRALHEAEMLAAVAVESKKRELVELQTANARAEADAKAYAIQTALAAFNGVDPKVLQALATTGMDARQLIALAFRELAEGADKIGQLNVSPDLLRELMDKRK